MDLADHSRFVQRIRRRYSNWLTLLPAGAPGKPTMTSTLSALMAQGLALGAALRVLRQLVIERLVVLDCGLPEKQASPQPALDEDRLALVTQVMTELAELALDEAMQLSAQTLDALYGAPVAPGSERAQMGWSAWASLAHASLMCPAILT